MNAQRRRILHAAIRCMGDLGPERTSIAAIARAAKLSTGALYKHFSNKDELVSEALRAAAMTEPMVPNAWPALRDGMASLDDEMGIDVATVARTNLQLLASSLRPGPLRGMLKPILEDSLSMLADRLTEMEAAGQIRLRMDPRATAACIAALADGLTWFGLARDQPRSAIAAEIAAGLECLVDLPDDRRAE